MTESEPLRRRDRQRATTSVGCGIFSADGIDGHGVDVRLLRGSPTPDEIAAVTAVLTSAVVEEASHSEAVPSDGPSAWQRSQKAVRSPVTAGPGRWRNFSA